MANETGLINCPNSNINSCYFSFVVQRQVQNTSRQMSWKDKKVFKRNDSPLQALTHHREWHCTLHINCSAKSSVWVRLKSETFLSSNTVLSASKYGLIHLLAVNNSYLDWICICCCCYYFKNPSTLSNTGTCSNTRKAYQSKAVIKNWGDSQSALDSFPCGSDFIFS